LYNELLENTDGTVAKRHIRIKQIKKNKGSVEGSVNRLRGIPNEKISLLRGKSRQVGVLATSQDQNRSFLNTTIKLSR
jgi:hypothetical protein